MKNLFGQVAGLLRGKPQGEAESSRNASAGMDYGSFSDDSFVYVEDNGIARELEADEVEYLNTKFEGGDGNRPYIKGTYEQLTPDKRIGGYLLRKALPASVRIRPASEATPVDDADEAIRIAKAELPISFCVKSGTRLQRVIDQRSGRQEFGLPGVDVAAGSFSAIMDKGVWRVVRQPSAAGADTEQTCFAEISAASGRIVRYGWV